MVKGQGCFGGTYRKIDLEGVRYLGIDEIHGGRERGVGPKRKAPYSINVIDLETGRIIYVARGRSEAALRPFFRRLRKAKIRIAAVSCDMAAAYCSAVPEHLPGAQLVFDRFHIVELINDRIDDIRR